MLKNKDWIKHSNLGFQIITTLALFGGIGYFLDNIYLNYKPFFFIVSLFIGVAISLYYLWRSLFK